jgi:hypothetical protein
MESSDHSLITLRSCIDDTRRNKRHIFGREIGGTYGNQVPAVFLGRETDQPIYKMFVVKNFHIGQSIFIQPVQVFSPGSSCGGGVVQSPEIRYRRRSPKRMLLVPKLTPIELLKVRSLLILTSTKLLVTRSITLRRSPDPSATASTLARKPRPSLTSFWLK